jgi:beta-glucanase (GH16 family)
LTKRFDGIDFTQDFHVYGIEWEPGEFRWPLDGQAWQVQKGWGTENGNFPQPFDQPFRLVFNLAVGG